MNREKSLLKNTLIISLGKICTKLITFLLLPLYTGILSTEEYGIIDLLNTLVSLLLPIITFQVEQAIFRELVEYRNNDSQKKVIISSGIFSVILQCFIFFTIYLIITPLLKNKYKYFLIIYVISSIFNSLFLQIARGLGNNTKFAIASFTSAFSTITLNILLLIIIPMGLNGMLIGTLLGQLISTIYMFLSLNLPKYLSLKSYNNTTVKKLWKYSLPLIPNQISWWIFNSSDKIIVSTLLGLSATGILSAANKFPAVFITFYNIFSMSWTESISLHIHDKDIKNYFNKMFNTILNLFSSMALIMIALMPFVYPIMINSKFKEGYNLVPILILASLFSVIVGLIGVLYVANKRTKEIAHTSIIAALINIVSHLLLIEFCGLYAAALSTLLAYFIMAIYRLTDVNTKFFPVKINKNNFIKTLLAFTLVLITYYINNTYINITSLIIITIIIYNLNKKSLKTTLKLIKKKVN